MPQEPVQLKYKTVVDVPHIHIGRTQKAVSGYPQPKFGMDLPPWNARACVLGLPLLITFEPVFRPSDQMLLDTYADVEDEVGLNSKPLAFLQSCIQTNDMGGRTTRRASSGPPKSSRRRPPSRRRSCRPPPPTPRSAGAWCAPRYRPASTTRKPPRWPRPWIWRDSLKSLYMASEIVKHWGIKTPT